MKLGYAIAGASQLVQAIVLEAIALQGNVRELLLRDLIVGKGSIEETLDLMETTLESLIAGEHITSSSSRVSMLAMGQQSTQVLSVLQYMVWQS